MPPKKKQPRVLRAPAYGPKGDRVDGGQPVPSTWPRWFIDDLEADGQLVDDPKHAVTTDPTAMKLVLGTKGA